MKTVNENPWPPHVCGGHYESPEKRLGVFDQFIMVKMEFRSYNGFVWEGGRAAKINRKYLNIESSNLKNIWGFT